MPESRDRDGLVSGDTASSAQEITEADVLMTGVLASRPAREPAFAAQSKALDTLAQHLLDEPKSLLKTLARLALDLCRADTVGVSLLETAPDGTSFFRWVAIAGALEALEQGTTPSNFSPCGTTLACNQPQLYSYPERFFTHLSHPQLASVEALVIPLCVNERALGTLWIVSHHEERHFDAEDQRLMLSLGGFTAAALHSLQQRQQTAATAWRHEQFSQQILDSSDDCIKVLDLEGRLLFISQPGQALLDIEDSTPLLNTSWAKFWQGADQQAAIEALAKARTGEVCTFQGYRPTLSGEPKWWDSKVSPIRGSEGQIERLLCISRDITQRRLAETALRASEAQYRTLFSAMDEGYLLADIIFDEHDQPSDIFYRDANPAATRLLGQAFTGRRLREIDPSYEAYWYETFCRVARTGNGERLEQYAAPQQKWYDFYVFKVGAEASRRVAIVFQDITERKRREANAAFLMGITEAFSRLSTVDELMQTVGAKVGEYLQVSTCDFADVDEARGEVTVHSGWNSPEVPSTVGTFRTTEYLSDEFVRASLAGETSVICDTQSDPRTDGPAYAALQMFAFVTVPFHCHGRWTHYIAVCDARPRDWRDDEIDLIQNISNCLFPRLERARAEAIVAADLQATQQLRELGARLIIEGDIQTLYQEIMSAAIALTKADAGTVQIFDEATQELVLLAAQGFERTMRERFHRVNASDNTPCGIALRNGAHSFVDFDVPQSEDPDDSMRMHVEAGYLSGQSTLLLTRSGRRIGMVSTHWHEHHRPSERELRFLDLLARQAADLIEQRQTVAEREQLLAREQAARVEADRANRVKDEFLAVLSHELRSPLNPILGWSKLLQHGKLDAAKTQQALQTIERNAKLQAELIEDLLDVSRILQGKLNLNVSSINLSSTIRAAMETVRLAAEAKAINLEASFEPDSPLVQGDSTRLQQVIWNLLSNAVKFTPAGGQVNIRLECLDSCAQMTISDTGQGIEPEFLPYVFEYFRQANATTTRKFGGLGLGLAIVRHLVELHGGTVAVESLGVGSGATFTVRLPLSPIQASATQNERASAAASTLHGIRVLVVDDEPDSREFVAFALEQAGAAVMTVATAFEALAMLQRWQPDVLLSDIGMPEMDGYMLMQQVRALPVEQGGQVRAIALTAYAGDFNQQQARQSGFQQHVSKPIEPEKLIQVLASLIKA